MFLVEIRLSGWAGYESPFTLQWVIRECVTSIQKRRNLMVDTRQTRPLYFMISSIVLVGGMALVYYVHREQTELKITIASLQKDRDLAKQVDVAAAEPVVIEKVVSKSEAWRPIQEKVHDTVIQIFAQKAEFNMLQPYKTPDQHTGSGTGFFINPEGELITNAHVINQAKAIWIQIPSLGKRVLEVELIGVSPERDLALLRLVPESLALVKKELGAVPYLTLGDSDLVRRSDEVMALGYPLGQQSLKSTTGVISGREQHMIQMSAALNPGNSGGPSVNIQGEVVGVNTANIPNAQNVGYLIPINDLKIVLPDLHKVTLLRKPFLGVLYNNATESLTEFLGNPQPGGCYVIEVLKESTLYKAGVQRGDMIYELNSHKIDIYGEMNVPWSEDKISIVDYVSRLSIGQDVSLVLYRNGKRKDVTVTFGQMDDLPIRTVYPGFESIDYEVLCGMVIMPLTINHIQLLAPAATGLARYAEMKYRCEPHLIVTHIFPSSELFKTRTLAIGATLNEVNGMSVKTLDDLRAALQKPVDKKFLTIKATDNIMCTSEHVFVALPFEKVVAQEEKLAFDYHYPLSDTMKGFLKKTQAVA